MFEATKAEEQQDQPEDFADVFPGNARIKDRQSTIDDSYRNQHAGVSMDVNGNHPDSNIWKSHIVQ